MMPAFFVLTSDAQQKHHKAVFIRFNKQLRVVLSAAFGGIRARPGYRHGA
jgi:hypothetical protein